MIDSLAQMFSQEAFWRGLAAALLAATPCAVLGVFLYLRRQSLVADALAHIALPGIVIAFLVTGSTDPLPMLAGAVALGMAASFGMGALEHRAGVRSDAAIGIVFTALFALGIVLLSMFVHDAHIDTKHTLFGDVLAISDDALLLLGAMAPVVLLGVALGWRWLGMVCFDQGFARVLGVPVAAVHYGLMAAASGTTVAAFEAVGAILVVAFVIVPAASAHLLCDRLHTMVFTAWGLGVLAVVLGMGAAWVFDISASGAIVLAQGLLYALCFLFAPRHGALRRAAPENLAPQGADP